GGTLPRGPPAGDNKTQGPPRGLLRARPHPGAPAGGPALRLFPTRPFPQSFYPRTAEPNRLLVEERFGAATIAALRERGHDVKVEGAWSLGRVCAAGRADGMVIAAATPRLMQAYAVGR